MKIAVMGAGGVGGYVGGRLAQAGAEVTLIARGQHLAALRAEGLRIETPEGVVRLPAIRAAASPREAGPQDLVLFTVKLTDAEAAAAALAPMIGPQTRVLTLQNGIDSQEILERHVGPGRVSAGAIYIAAYIKAPGVVLHPGGIHRIAADPMDGDPVMAAFLALDAAVDGLDIGAAEDPDAVIWGKFVTLSAFSGITCLARSPIGRVFETPETLAFYRDLMDETVAVAAAAGHPMPRDFAVGRIENFRKQPWEMKSSMLVDLEAGKPLELPWLSGRVVELGEALGVPVPANRAVVAALAPFVDGRSD